MKKNALTLLMAFASLASNLFGQELTLPYTFQNDSRYADQDIYIGLLGQTSELGYVWMDMSDSTLKKMSADDNTIPGPDWYTSNAEWLFPDIFTKLSNIENNTISIPQGLFGCRIFISFESPMYFHFHEGDNAGYAGANLNDSEDPNDGIRWEIVELTWGDAGLWTNTSRVDAYQYPMGLKVTGVSGGITSGTYEASYYNAINDSTENTQQIGELLSHQEILKAWNNTVSTPYLAAKIIKSHSIDGEAIIEQPSKIEVFPKDILDDYIDEIWETYKNYDLAINIGDRGTWIGRVQSDDSFLFTDPADNSIATIYGKPETVDAIEGKGFLAYTPVDASENLIKNNEDLMIQAQIAAAISRHAIYTDIIDGTIQYSHDANRFFVHEPYNEYVKFFHSETISLDSQTYAFAYDDVGDHSSTIQSTFPKEVTVIIGGYGENTNSESTESINEEEEGNEITSLEIITPSEEYLITNSPIVFEAQAYDQNKNPVESSTITWSVISGEATITDTGIFTTSIAGDYIIRAIQNDISIEEIVVITEILNTENCSGTAANGDYTYNIIGDLNNPSITFIPTEETIGNKISRLHYSTSKDAIFTELTITPNEPFQIIANEAEIVYFYFSYNVGDIENNTADNMHSFQVGNCNTTNGVFDSSNISDFGNEFTLYPNPTNGRNPHLTGLNEDVTINIYTLGGKLISTDDTINVDTIKIKTLSFASGLYLVSVITKDNKFSKTFKLLVD